MSISAVGGKLSRGDKFNSNRGNVDLKFVGDSLKLPGINYNADYISSSDETFDYKGIWIRQNGRLEYKVIPFMDRSGAAEFGTYKLNVQFNGEDKQTRSLQFDTTSASSFRFYEFKPGINVTDLLNVDLSYNFAYRMDDAFSGGSLQRLSNSYTQTYGMALRVKLCFCSRGSGFIR
jgi:hypothetical protein